MMEVVAMGGSIVVEVENKKEGMVGPAMTVHAHTCTLSPPTKHTFLYIHLIFTFVSSQRLTCLQFCLSFFLPLSLSRSPNTVVYCAAWPGPCPKAKRTQIAETEGPLLTGRPSCSCYSLLWPSKPMGTAGWAQKLCAHVCVCLCTHAHSFWSATEGFFGQNLQEPTWHLCAISYALVKAFAWLLIVLLLHNIIQTHYFQPSFKGGVHEDGPQSRRQWQVGGGDPAPPSVLTRRIKCISGLSWVLDWLAHLSVFHVISTCSNVA